MARPERFELPTAWFVARYSIQLSYGRILIGLGIIQKSSDLSFELAEREGFEPSIGINLYSLSRGAPSATRPPLRETHFNCFTAYHHQTAAGITPGACITRSTHAPRALLASGGAGCESRICTQVLRRRGVAYLCDFMR